MEFVNNKLNALKTQIIDEQLSNLKQKVVDLEQDVDNTYKENFDLENEKNEKIQEFLKKINEEYTKKRDELSEKIVKIRGVIQNTKNDIEELEDEKKKEKEKIKMTKPTKSYDFPQDIFSQICDFAGSKEKKPTEFKVGKLYLGHTSFLTSKDSYYCDDESESKMIYLVESRTKKTMSIKVGFFIHSEFSHFPNKNYTVKIFKNKNGGEFFIPHYKDRMCYEKKKKSKGGYCDNVDIVSPCNELKFKEKELNKILDNYNINPKDVDVSLYNLVKLIRNEELEDFTNCKEIEQNTVKCC